jgi:hypothetical protein
VVEEGLPCEEWHLRSATKHAMHPSGKAIVNEQPCWGRWSKLPERGGMQPVELRVPLHRNIFVTNWGLGMVEGVIYVLS